MCKYIVWATASMLERRASQFCYENNCCLFWNLKTYVSTLCGQKDSEAELAVWCWPVASLF